MEFVDARRLLVPFALLAALSGAARAQVFGSSSDSPLAVGVAPAQALTRRTPQPGDTAYITQQLARAANDPGRSPEELAERARSAFDGTINAAIVFEDKRGTLNHYWDALNGFHPLRRAVGAGEVLARTLDDITVPSPWKDTARRALQGALDMHAQGRVKEARLDPHTAAFCDKQTRNIGYTNRLPSWSAFLPSAELGSFLAHERVHAEDPNLQTASVANSELRAWLYGTYATLAAWDVTGEATALTVQLLNGWHLANPFNDDIASALPLAKTNNAVRGTNGDVGAIQRMISALYDPDTGGPRASPPGGSKPS